MDDGLPPGACLVAQTRCAAEAGTLLETATGVAPVSLVESQAITAAATMPGKAGRCKGETYETDVIGDSCRNRTGTASDTKAVTTAIMVVGRCRPCPLGLGGFLDVIGCGRRICTATAQPLLQPWVTWCRHTVGAYTPTNKKRTQSRRIPSARHRRRSRFPCCFLFIVAWKFCLANC